MDSLTQFALGACVGVAVLGRKIGPRHAALTGGILGTLPDLDVFLAPDDPIESFVQHRGWSHSLFVHVALTPVFGEAARRLFKPLRDHRTAVYSAVFLCLSTHTLLDAITVYGTRLFWPYWTEPIALGSIFIIDPLYTLPLLIAVIWAFAIPHWTSRYRRGLTVCLGISSAYLGWTITAQYWLEHKARALLASKNIVPDRIMVTPTPFNSILWRVIGIDGERSFNLYMPVTGSAQASSFYAYNRNRHFVSCSSDNGRIAKVAEFSRGYYRILVKGGEISVADLRMGLTPNYAFRFSLGRLDAGNLISAPTRRLEGRGNFHDDLEWLIANFRGNAATRPAEAAARIDLSLYASANIESAWPRRC